MKLSLYYAEINNSSLLGHNSSMKKEFVFQIEQDEGMLVATCHEPEMATQGENLDGLPAMIRDLIRCRFDEGDERLAWAVVSALIWGARAPIAKEKRAGMRRGQLFSPDYTVNLFADVEFWMERMPALLGSAPRLRQAGAKRLFPLLI